MKKRIIWMIALLCASPFGGWGAGAWAQSEVGNETDLRSAITDDVNIKLTADIPLTDGKLDIGSNTVTIDLNGHKLSRSLSANENYGMVIYVNGGNLTINDGSGDQTSNTSNDQTTNSIRAFVLNFGDEKEANRITTTYFTNDTNSSDAWYDMQGRRLDGKPSRAGIYINNANKIVIK